MQRFALADCNNFFVSCERVFDPKLIGKPVVVLSSNDGCIIARSNEAKKLGIKMGEPAFMSKELFKKNNVLVLSSNFPLYADMSSRIMQTLAEYATDIELYSVDEAFLYFPSPGIACETIQKETDHYTNYAHYVRKKVQQNIGIPVSIGLGPTKTLAKIANHLAKKNPTYAGAFDLTNHPHLDDLLKTIDVAEVWGIGYRYTKFLHARGIKNVYQLTQCNDSWVRKNMTINGLKTVLELRGIPCLSIQDIAEPKKSITVSRSFGKNVTDKSELKEALSFHASTAAEKLRKQHMITHVITVFVCFIHHYDAHRIYTSSTCQLQLPTSYTPDIITAAHNCLEKLFKKGVIYKKVGLILDDFYPADGVQMSTFYAIPDIAKQSNMMKTIDIINDKMGRNAIFFASSGINQTWHAKKTKRSPAYTTNWNELLTIKI